MNLDRFRELIADELAPMLGALLEDEPIASTAREQNVAYDGPTALLVKLNRDDAHRLRLWISRPFDDEEKRLAEDFVREASALSDLDEKPYFRDLVQALPKWVIARHAGPRRLLKEVLEQLEKWSSETYEGQRISCAVGLSADAANTNLDVHEHWNEPYAPVLSNGFDTLLAVGRDSQVHGPVQLVPPAEVGYSPYRLGQIANWTQPRNRVAVALNAQGEIVLFKEAKLRFAKRSGQWTHVVHSSAVEALSPCGSRGLREEVYRSCLDVSFARTGGCIAIAKATQASRVTDLVDKRDRLKEDASYKARLFRSAATGNFQDLDRRLRQEILALDGAVVLSHKGEVLAVGAIVKVGGGSTGGGRRAAAVALSRVGVGVKISADGPIEFFKGGELVFDLFARGAL